MNEFPRKTNEELAIGQYLICENADDMIIGRITSVTEGHYQVKLLESDHKPIKIKKDNLTWSSPAIEWRFSPIDAETAICKALRFGFEQSACKRNLVEALGEMKYIIGRCDEYANGKIDQIAVRPFPIG